MPKHSEPDQPKRRRNWDRIIERVEWCATGLLVLSAVLALLFSHYVDALQSALYAAITAQIAVWFRGRARLSDHDTVVRIYDRGRLRADAGFDFPPGSDLRVGGVVVTGCTCGEDHVAEPVPTDQITPEPDKDGL